MKYRWRDEITGSGCGIIGTRNIYLSTEETEDRNFTLAASDGYYKYLFDNLSVCMFFVDVTSEGRFQYAGFNLAEEKAVGLSSQQVMGKFVEDVFAPDVAQELIGNYRRCLQAGTPITFEDELNMPAGRRYFLSNLIPFRNGEGERIHRIVGACIDITELKRTQEEAISRHKLESLGVIAATVAHDMSNLLGVISVQADLAKSELTAGAPAEANLRTIQTVATSGGELARDLMGYAGVDSTTWQRTDLTLLVRELPDLLKLFVSKRASLQFVIPEKSAMVDANPAQLRQVIINLVSNASDALGDRDGVISIGITEASPPDAGSTRAARDWVRLTIRDSGCGMKPEVLERIFDPFYTTKSSGRGLGLAATVGIIRDHGGAIHVTSVPSQGSEFEILLPGAEAGTDTACVHSAALLMRAIPASGGGQ